MERQPEVDESPLEKAKAAAAAIAAKAVAKDNGVAGPALPPSASVGRKGGELDGNQGLFTGNNPLVPFQNPTLPPPSPRLAISPRTDC